MSILVSHLPMRLDIGAQPLAQIAKSLRRLAGR